MSGLVELENLELGSYQNKHETKLWELIEAKKVELTEEEEVENLKQRIAELEKENERLKAELERVKSEQD